MKKISAGVIFQNNKILACQRKKDSYYGLKWEFPGGKVENDEDVRECLIRELREELNITPVIGKLFYIEKFKYPDGFEFEISFFIINEYNGEIKNIVFEEIRWVNLSDLSTLDFLEADKEVIGLLQKNQFEFKKYYLLELTPIPFCFKFRY
jgi:8-oxo-dGTP diphosphatase